MEITKLEVIKLLAGINDDIQYVAEVNDTPHWQYSMLLEIWERVDKIRAITQECEDSNQQPEGTRLDVVELLTGINNDLQFVAEVNDTPQWQFTELFQIWGRLDKVRAEIQKCEDLVEQ
jgi:hypothetical protein